MSPVKTAADKLPKMRLSPFNVGLMITGATGAGLYGSHVAAKARREKTAAKDPGHARVVMSLAKRHERDRAIRKRRDDRLIKNLTKKHNKRLLLATGLGAAVAGLGAGAAYGGYKLLTRKKERKAG